MQDGAGKRRGLAGEPQVRRAPLHQPLLRRAPRARRPQACSPLAPHPHSLSGLPPHPERQCWACLSPWAQPQVGDRPTRPTSPGRQGFRGSLTGGGPRKQDSGLGSSSHGPCPHTAPHPRRCSLSRLPGWSRLVLGPHEAQPDPRLFPSSGMPVPEAPGSGRGLGCPAGGPRRRQLV